MGMGFKKLYDLFLLDEAYGWSGIEALNKEFRAANICTAVEALFDVPINTLGE